MKLNIKSKATIAISFTICVYFVYYVSVDLHGRQQYARVDSNSVVGFNQGHPTFSLGVLNFSKQGHCEKTTSLVYVKTHKTASSFVKTVLRKLLKPSVEAYPAVFIGGYPGLFDERFVFPKEEVQTINMIAGHFRFNKPAIQSLMQTVPKYVTIVRNPLRQFESSFHYYYGFFGNSKVAIKKIPCFATPYYQVMNKFNASLSEYINAAVTSLNDSIPWYFRSRNYQSFDLGMDPKKTDDEAYIRSYVEELDSTFDLVMIQDYFFESLVLLRETVCLDWEHLIFRQTNNPTYNYEKHNFTEDEKLKLQGLLKQDFILYDHMNKTFWRKVEKYGRERMKNDVSVLKARLEELPPKNRKNLKRKIKDFHEKISDDELSQSDIGRTQNNMDILRERIEKDCASRNLCEIFSDKTWLLSEYMADSGGYCPF